MLSDCGCSIYILNDMKKGSMPSADKIASIASYLGVSTEYLVGITNDPTPPNKKDSLTSDDLYRILAKEKNLTEKDIEYLKHTARLLEIKNNAEQLNKNLEAEISTELTSDGN